MQPIVESFLHAPSSTWTHLVVDPATRSAALVDPVLDFDYPSGSIATDSADAILAHVRAMGLTLEWVLETHAHADHLTAAQHLRARLGTRVGIGAGIREVQAHFRRTLDFEPQFRADGSQFDCLFEDGETFALGAIEVRVMATPGHTRDSLSYRIGDAVFVGDTLFMPDGGTARCDFPGGDAGMLYDSIQKLYALPAATRMFLCHDYPPPGRAPCAVSSIDAQRHGNIHAHAGVTRAQFIALRDARDRSLELPALLYPAVQVNVRAGALPPPARNGAVYLKVPVHLRPRDTRPQT